MATPTNDAAHTGVWRPPVTPTPAGRKVGKYEIVELIGAGAMGTVYRAHDPDLQRDVAIKLMSLGFAHDGRLRDRFLREARAAGSLQHPNIITIYGFGESEEHLFIAMEYVEGRDVSDIIRNQVTMPLGEKIEIVRGLLAGLAYAHARGITHRDIKPSNIRLTREGRVKIMDFGIAHLAESDLTNTGMVLGTPSYIAPEQVKGADPTPAADVFSVGAVLYELLTYRKPFAGDTAHAVLYAVLNNEPSLGPELKEVPAALRSVVQKALEKDPDRRYQTAVDMAYDLERAREAADSDSDTTLVVAPPSPGPRRRRWVSRRTTVGAAAVLAGVIWMLNATRSPAPTPTPVAPSPPVAPAAVLVEPADSVAVTDTFDPDTLVTAVRAAALASRAAMDQERVPTDLLAPGDSLILHADSLFASGQYSAAITMLSRAQTEWRLAEREHERRQLARAAADRRRSSRRPSPPRPQPTPTRTAPPPATPADNWSAIQTSVNHLAAALESRNIDRLREVYPRLTPKERDTWQQFFNTTKDLRITLTLRDLTTDGDTGRAVVDGTYTYRTASGEQQRDIAFGATFLRIGSEWRVQHLGGASE